MSRMGQLTIACCFCLRYVSARLLPLLAFCDRVLYSNYKQFTKYSILHAVRHGGDSSSSQLQRGLSASTSGMGDLGRHRQR